MENRKKKYMLLYCIVCQVRDSAIEYAMHSKPKRQSRAGARFSRSNCSTVAIGKFAFAYKGVVYSAGNLNISTLGFPAIYLYFRGERNRGRELDIPSHGENMECQ